MRFRADLPAGVFGQAALQEVPMESALIEHPGPAQPLCSRKRAVLSRFDLTLEEALQAGAIIRGMDTEEPEAAGDAGSRTRQAM
jgi:hypothetical protein